MNSFMVLRVVRIEFCIKLENTSVRYHDNVFVHIQNEEFAHN